MFILISDVLDKATLSSLRDAIEDLRFEDGRATAGRDAALQKHNRQAQPSPALRHVQDRLQRAIEDNSMVRAAALPAKIGRPMISKYGHGDRYGTHVDDALMGSPPLRSDLSFTVFLNDPDAYEGGELVVETASGEDAIKSKAGGLVLYPSTSLHRVEEVRSGERLAAVGWIQSLVRDQSAREILFDLGRAKAVLSQENSQKCAYELISKSYSNLLRRWANP